MSKTYRFPEGFLWGTATAAHQVEGGNKNTDWWKWEQNRKTRQKWPVEASGEACDSYNRYEEDLDLNEKLGSNSIRLSIEWARIEPQNGTFDKKEIEHYRKVLQSAKNRGMKTFVTLWHFTNPLWFAKKRGWHWLKSSWHFARYSKKIAEELGELIDVFLPINEPQVYTLMAYTTGIWPPNKHNLILSYAVQIKLIRAHWRAYDAIKSVNKDYQVGIVKNIVWYEADPYKSSFIDKFTAKFLNYIGRDFFLNPILKKSDVIGVNYYFTYRVKNFKTTNPPDSRSDLEWWINPDGLYEILMYLKKFNMPIYITENGLADAKDRYRGHFIRNMLLACHKAIEEGVDLRGYFHWSLIDNFEWHQGFWPRFGLVEIDHKNDLARKPRESFYYYANICKNNRVEI